MWRAYDRRPSQARNVPRSGTALPPIAMALLLIPALCLKACRFILIDSDFYCFAYLIMTTYIGTIVIHLRGTTNATTSYVFW